VQIHSDAQIDTLYTLVISRSFKERANQAELSGQYDSAKEHYNDLKQFETLKITPDNLPHRNIPNVLTDKQPLTSQLVQKRARVSYHCCYCGAVSTLRSTSLDIPNYCAQCGAELDVIDFEKIIQKIRLS
jgi:hypothetical protein